MPNPYSQVALTYVRRLKNYQLIAIGLLCIFGIVDFLRHPVETVPFGMFMIGVFLSLALGMHLQSQIFDARSRLMPNFRRVHATVAIVIVLICNILFPTALSLLAGLRSFGLASFFMLAFSIFTFLSWKSMPFILIAIPFISSSIAGRIFLNGFISGEFELQAYSLLLISMGTSVWGVIRLFRMTEEDPEYQKSYATGSKNAAAGQNPTAVPFFGKGWQDRLTDRHVARLAAHARRASTSAWSRICRWQMGVSFALVLRIVFLTVMISFLSVVVSHGKQLNSIMLAMYVGIIPLSALGVIFQAQKLDSIMHLPVERISLIRQMGLSAALSFISTLVLSWSIMLLLFTQVFHVQIRNEILCNLVLISSLTNILLFGLGAWLARYRSKILQFGSLMVLYFLQMVLMISASEYQHGNFGTTMVLIAAVAAVVGLLITFDAYRRWLVADLD